MFAFFPQEQGEQGEHINKFDPHPVRGQSRKVVYAYWFFLPRPATETEPETGIVSTVFPETEKGTGAVFQEPKPEPEPFLSVQQ